MKAGSSPPCPAACRISTSSQCQCSRPAVRRRPPKSSMVGGWLQTAAAVLGLRLLVVFVIARLPALAAGISACSAGPVTLGVRDSGTLAELVKQANCLEGQFSVSWEGTVLFEEPIVVGNLTSLNITGVGGRAVLEGGGVSRLIEVAEGASLVLENLELRNASESAIRSDGAQLNLQSCNFTTNVSPGDGGGAILSTGGLAAIDLANCRFENNVAHREGGAIRAESPASLIARNTVFLKNLVTSDDFDGLGGAIFVSEGTPQLEFHGCDFQRNNASTNGGALYYDAGGSMMFNGTSFVGNWARESGGGIFAKGAVGQVDVLDSVFEENFVSNIGSWVTGLLLFDGGGLVIYGTRVRVTVRSSNFSRNGAENGGAMALRGSYALEVEDCLVEENIAKTQGGGILLTGFGNSTFSATFTDTIFRQNWCGGSGGGLYALTSSSGNVALSRADFSNNSVVYRSDFGSFSGSYRGGAYYSSGADMNTVAADCRFQGNEAGAVGGALALDGGIFSAEDCLFSDNMAGNGGAIAASHDSDGFDRDGVESSTVVHLLGGALLRNSAVRYPNGSFDRGNGGALRVENGAGAKLESVVVEGNTGAFGGAISVSAGSRTSSSNSTFSLNVAGITGGAVQVWGNDSRFVSDGCVFISNVAEVLNGDFATTSTSSNVESPTMDDAGASGGAISATDGGVVFLTDSKLSGNVADGRGGGVYCGTTANVIASRVNFDGHTSGARGNSEAHGGGCAAANACLMNLANSVFSGNEAIGASGGAISAENGSDVSASWCVFSGNKASGGGALYGTGGDTKIALENCLVDGNMATKEGGGLRAYFLGIVRADSCNFSNNQAGELGGGVHCFGCQLSSINSTFQSNTAGDGGAMRVSYASQVKIKHCRFVDNEAFYDGGAIAVDTALSQATSSGDRGALSIDQSNETDNDNDESSVKMECLNSSFYGNRAGERGGSLYSTVHSVIELQDCNSTSNSASLGGSIFMSRSDFVLAKCLFSGDTVPTGATIYAVGANIRAREVSFVDTTSNTGILALQAVVGTLFEAQDCSFAGWRGSSVVQADNSGKLWLDSCDFSGSTASKLVEVQDGGGLAVIRNARLTTSNYEAINYGADLMSTEGQNSSIFGSNIMGCDGSECSSDDCQEGDLGVYCACYELVVDFTTACLGRSGTLELTALDPVVSTKFPEDPSTSLQVSMNETELGGPVLWTLEWTNDPSSVEWRAVPSKGLAYPGETITISLKGEVARYWNGLSSTVITAIAPFQNYMEPSVAIINATFVYCPQGQYWDGSERLCKLCSLVGDGVDCTAEGILLETLPLAKGFWRSVVSSTTVRECFKGDACVGSAVDERISTSDDYCATGYEGPYCSVCTVGYTIGVSHTCRSCDSSFRAGMVVVMALVGVILVVGIVIVIHDLVSNPALTDLSDTPFSLLSRRLRRFPFHKLKIPLVVFQIMTQYASITSIEFPPMFQTFLSAIGVINLELGWLFTAACLIDVDFHIRLLAATIGPLVVLLVLLGTYFYTCKKHGLRPPPEEALDQAMYPLPGYRSSPASSETEIELSVLRRVQDKHTTVALTIAFLLYSTVSTVIFQTFTCDDLEDVDMRYLRADYAIKCDSNRHKLFQVYSAIMILVYPIGIPVAFAIMLFGKRRLINPPTDTRPSPDVLCLTSLGEEDEEKERKLDPRLADGRIAQTSFLWKPYRPGAYYFEVLECLRRLLLTGCLVFILPNSAGQAAVACVLSVLTVIIYAVVDPYLDPHDHRAYTLGALAIFFAMFMGLTVKVNLADEKTQSQEILAALLIVLTVGLLVVAVVDCLLEARNLSRADRDGSNDGHVFLRRRYRKRKEGGGACDHEKFGTGERALYAPKLLDVPASRALERTRNPNINDDAFDEKMLGAGAGGGIRQRGTQMFMQSSSADSDHTPHVAIAGTSSYLHPSHRGVPHHARVSSGGFSAGGGDFSHAHKQCRSSSGSHSPIHNSNRSQKGSHCRKESGGSLRLVPAEAESAPPEGIEMEVPISMGSSIAGGGGSRQGSSRPKRSSRSSSRREGRGSSRSSRRKPRDSGGGGMQPAMPAAGPVDEMRPSPGPDEPFPPGPWNSMS